MKLCLCYQSVVSHFFYTCSFTAKWANIKICLLTSQHSFFHSTIFWQVFWGLKIQTFENKFLKMIQLLSMCKLQKCVIVLCVFTTLWIWRRMLICTGMKKQYLFVIFVDPCECFGNVVIYTQTFQKCKGKTFSAFTLLLCKHTVRNSCSC